VAVTALEWETIDDAVFLFNCINRSPFRDKSGLARALFGGFILVNVSYIEEYNQKDVSIVADYYDGGCDVFTIPRASLAAAIRDVYAPPYPYALRSRNGREAAEVIQSRATMFGCCDRHADYRACNCLGLSGMFVPEQFPKRSTELAESIYQEISKQTDPRLPADALMVLSDSLEEFGLPTEYLCWVCRGKGNDPRVPVTPGQFITEVACDNCNGEGHLTHPILAHLRNGKTHFDGCWALQLLRNLENANG
jgi:hypothetical protein